MCDCKTGQHFTEVAIIRIMRKGLLLFVMLLTMLCVAGTVHAAAKTVNAVTQAKTVSGGKWVTTKKGKKYRYENGTYAKSTWLNVNGQIYRIKKNGVRATGWFTVGGKSFYASKTGKLYVKRWLKQDGSRYYFQGTGICAKKKWVKIDGTCYYFLKSGKMAQMKMIKRDGAYYYVDKTGTCVTSSWVTLDGKKYYFDKNGIRIQKQWMKKGGNWYYFLSNGVLAVNRWINNTYYVGQDGVRQTDTYVNGFYLDENGKKMTFPYDTIFVGDSRMVGMKMSVGSKGVHYIAKVGEGYSWLTSTAGPQLKNTLQTRPDATVVLALGVNDMGNISNYISYYRNLVNAYPKAKIYMLSVNPLNDDLAGRVGYMVRNKDVKAFNKKLKEAFPERYINAYKYLIDHEEFRTSDGIHYTADTYKILHTFILETLNGSNKK